MIVRDVEVVVFPKFLKGKLSELLNVTSFIIVSLFEG